MGAAAARYAVFDAAGLWWAGGVRIADASVMPDVPRGKTNIPTIHTGRKTCERNRTSLAFTK
jgi:choline dehydrogenase-like flavoprotein